MNEIAETIRYHLHQSDGKEMKVYVLPKGVKFEQNKMLDLIREIKPFILKDVVAFYSQLQVIVINVDLKNSVHDDDLSKQELEEKYFYLPTSLAPSQLFSLLPHLLSPGIKFSIRGQVINAIIAYLRCPLLKIIAKDFLDKNVQTIFKDNVPENFTYGIGQLFLQVPEYLSKQQIILYQKLMLIESLKRMVMKKEVSVKITQSILQNVKIFDRKRQCTHCKHWRSETLIPDPNGRCVCGLCLASCNENSYPDDDAKNSYIYQCHACHSHYAVVDRVLTLSFGSEKNKDIHYSGTIGSDHVHITRKCHQCLSNKDSIGTRCVGCHKKWVTYGDQKEKFVCSCCDAKINFPTIEKNVVLCDLLTENKEAIQEFLNIPAVMDDKGQIHKSMFDLMPIVRDAKECEKKDQIILFWQNERIINGVEIIKLIHDTLVTPEKTKRSCTLCFDDCKLTDLLQVCDEKKCDAMACKGCLVQWYDMNKIGCIVNVANAKCPFCRHAPSLQFLKKYTERPLCAKNTVWDPQLYHAWCGTCLNVKPYVEKKCAGEQPKLKNYICDSCSGFGTIVKACPRCKTMTMKDFGCDHMKCSRESYHAHWCWKCGGEFTADTIYDHMLQSHGSYGIIANPDED